MMLRRGFCLVALCAFIFGCTRAPKANTPEAVLDQYVSSAFDAKSVDDRKSSWI